jgi:signal transduction histidine kinase
VTDEPAPGQVEPLRIIVGRCRTLTTLVENITTIVESKGHDPRSEVVSLHELVDMAVADFGLMAERSELSLQVQISAEVPPVMGNRHQLRTVVDNLLDNALKFTPAGGVVTIGLHGSEVGALTSSAGGQPDSPGGEGKADRSGEVVFRVADTGIGIAPRHHDQIFDRFFQVDGTLRRSYGGSGLGLALVKEIVEAHHGSVHVESDLGQGSAFVVRLPAAGLAGPAG